MGKGENKKLRHAEREVERLELMLAKRRERVARAEAKVKKAKDHLAAVRADKTLQSRGAEEVAAPAGPGGSGL